MKTFCIATVFILLKLNCAAQDDLTNLQKYWHYRYRLTNYFMVVGSGPGKSLPAGFRDRNSTDQNNTSELSWGETPVYLGYYIGVLATEYRLLIDNNQPPAITDRTLTELYYAIEAVRRLDLFAEEAWQPNSGTINGFLARDDVPNNFVSQNADALNIDISLGQGIIHNSGKPGFDLITDSDYLNNQLQNTPKNNVVSQDITYHLLMGFALVSKFIPPGTGANGFGNYVTNVFTQVDIWSLARDEADLIISYIKYNHGDHWKIDDPDGHGVVGHGADFYAYPIAKAGHLITGYNYEDFYSAADEPLWQALQYRCPSLCEGLSDDASNHDMEMVLAAMSDSWRDVAGNNTTPNAILTLGDFDAGYCITPYPCSYLGNHYGWDVFYGSLWDAFHGGQTFIADLCKARQILNSAPYDGPFYHSDYAGNPNDGVAGWRCSRRFFQDPPSQDNGQAGNNGNFFGNFNGLDYMLLFNLYYLDSKEQSSPTTVPSLNPFISGVYPYNDYSCSPPCVLGDQADHAQIFSPTFPVIVNSLQLNANAPSPAVSGLGNLEIYGGPQGVLLQNTTVQNYSTLFVHCTDINTFCLPLNDYSFTSSSYQYRFAGDNGEGNSSKLPPYIPTAEFMQTKSQMNSSNLLSVFPNPNSGKFDFKINAATNTSIIYHITVTDLLGNLIYKTDSPSPQSSIDLGENSKGIYILRVFTDDGRQWTQRLVVQ